MTGILTIAILTVIGYTVNAVVNERTKGDAACVRSLTHRRAACNRSNVYTATVAY